MQIAAQIEKAPATPRECGGHHGSRFVPVQVGDGRWAYYWLSLPQQWFWQSRIPSEKARLIRRGKPGCFVCHLQEALERESFYGDGA